MDQSTQTNGANSGQGQTQAQGDYNIPQVVLDKYPDLVALIKSTESMTRQEREYWFQILPIMTEEQVTRLRMILEEEATQLKSLDAKYQDELQKMNKKHLEEWDTFEHEKTREAIAAKEAAEESAEKTEEEKLLQQLDQGNT